MTTQHITSPTERNTKKDIYIYIYVNGGGAVSTLLPWSLDPRLRYNEGDDTLTSYIHIGTHICIATSYVH